MKTKFYIYCLLALGLSLTFAPAISIISFITHPEPHFMPDALYIILTSAMSIGVWTWVIVEIIKEAIRNKIIKTGTQGTATVVKILKSKTNREDRRLDRYKVEYTWLAPTGEEITSISTTDYLKDEAQALQVQHQIDIMYLHTRSEIISEPNLEYLDNSSSDY